MPRQVLSLLGTSHARAGLIAIVEGPTSAPNGSGASLWVYLSSDGRRYRLPDVAEAGSATWPIASFAFLGCGKVRSLRARRVLFLDIDDFAV